MNLAHYIDHTLLKPEATPLDVTRLCEEAVKYGFASVCINPSYVSLAKQILAGTPVKVCTVIGFPLGATTTITKAIEMDQALEDGADEFDMVISIGHLKSGDTEYVKNQICTLAEIAHDEGKILKVIIETALLTDAEKHIACLIAEEAGADFVKTSTGTQGGALVADVLLMRAAVGPKMGIKASGGISDYIQAFLLIEAGATRIGTSQGLAIMAGTPIEGLGVC